MAIVKPDWIEIPRIDGVYEFQVDINASSESPRHVRHRPRRYTGESDDGWIFGHPPGNKLTVSRVADVVNDGR